MMNEKPKTLKIDYNYKFWWHKDNIQRICQNSDQKWNMLLGFEGK